MKPNYVELIARIWCNEEHSGKEMDVALLKSIGGLADLAYDTGAASVIPELEQLKQILQFKDIQSGVQIIDRIITKLTLALKNHVQPN
jgi:hypothetical protein